VRVLMRRLGARIVSERVNDWAYLVEIDAEPDARRCEVQEHEDLVLLIADFVTELQRPIESSTRHDCPPRGLRATGELCDKHGRDRCDLIAIGKRVCCEAGEVSQDAAR
jgi:hypothetical protein